MSLKSLFIDNTPMDMTMTRLEVEPEMTIDNKGAKIIMSTKTIITMMARITAPMATMAETHLGKKGKKAKMQVGHLRQMLYSERWVKGLKMTYKTT
uniref:Uncharacterized protein n=1 Tax=Cannabis sativa TaxID=3483 RepID=A0A803NRY5_CANSA